MDQPKHQPVLLHEVLDLLRPEPGDNYLDMTAGYGGHASAIAKRLGSKGRLTLVDRDKEAIKHLKNVFNTFDNVEIIHSDFLSAAQRLHKERAKFDVVLADLGVSSQHFNNANRGFSLKASGPLDMRMDASQKITAADIVNEADEEELARILHDFGEIKNARALTKKIVQSRPYSNTLELASHIEKLSKVRSKKIHPATQVFQALRIAVNDELTQLKKSLPIWVDILNTGGRLGVISFHSLEDRLVKQTFSEYGGKRYDAALQTVTKKPVMASVQEVVFNPRARSAKLRVAKRK